MNIKDLLSENNVNFSLKGNNKEDIIKEMAELMYQNGNITEYEGFINNIFERENKVSTGIGRGIAIPHTISKFVKKSCIAFGKSDKGIDFSAIDGKQCHIFLMIAVSEEKSDEHIKIISHIARKIAHTEIVNGLIEVNSFDALIELLV